MKGMPRRMFLSLAVWGAAAGATGCWGSFAATNKLWKFNDGISDSKWLKWLLFLGLVIIPVYSLFILGDALIFNTIEFFTDKNPLSGDIRDLGNGHQVAFERDPNDRDLVRIEHRHEGKVIGVFYVKRNDEGFALLDEKRRLLADVSERGEIVTLTDQDGRELTRIEPEDFRKASARLKETGSPKVALGDALGDGAALERMARARGAAVGNL